MSLGNRISPWLIPATCNRIQPQEGLRYVVVSAYPPVLYFFTRRPPPAPYSCITNAGSRIIVLTLLNVNYNKTLPAYHIAFMTPSVEKSALSVEEYRSTCGLLGQLGMLPVARRFSVLCSGAYRTTVSPEISYYPVYLSHETVRTANGIVPAMFLERMGSEEPDERWMIGIQGGGLCTSAIAQVTNSDAAGLSFHRVTFHMPKVGVSRTGQGC